MIVRDEVDGIAEMLATVKPVVGSWCIVDTGSSDETPAVLERELAGIPGKLHHRPWKNFAINRTEALQLAQGSAHYHLMLDADHRLEVDGERPDLTADSYMIRIQGTGNLEWRLPLLTRDGVRFEYRGAAHSYLASPYSVTEEPLDWLIVHGGPGASVEKLERDRELLTEAFRENPGDTRTVFYLARTHDDLDEWKPAITFYRLRARMGGWQEEVYYSRYRLGCLLCKHVSFAQGADELMGAWRDRPGRIEALRALANAANAVADKASWPTDALFVERHAYKQAA